MRRFLLSLFAIGLGLLAYSYFTAVSEPVVRHARVTLKGWPPGEPPVRAVLISDIHVAGPDMPPDRLQRIVVQINAPEPDLVFIAGDLVSEKRVATRRYTMAEAVAPLGGLRPRIGSFAVLGNHDHWSDAAGARSALRAAGVRLLSNDAARAGPLAVGGLDDAFTGRHDLRRTVRRMRAIGGAPVLLSHSPDPFPHVPADVGLMVAGHTHCGQIRLPLVGALSTMSAYGERYACGHMQENGHSLIVTAGLGTSLLPLRLGAAPDLWLIELGPSVER